VNPQEILDRITGTQPHIDPKSLQVLGERVGLRPCRPSVRVEPEFFQGGRKIVVHNYGHGIVTNECPVQKKKK